MKVLKGLEESPSPGNCQMHHIDNTRWIIVPFVPPERKLSKVKNTNLYVEIKDLDLIAKEFKLHKHCYQQFTHGYTKGVCNEEQLSTSNDRKYDSGNFEAVKVFVCNHVLKLGKAQAWNKFTIYRNLGLEIPPIEVNWESDYKIISWTKFYFFPQLP